MPFNLAASAKPFKENAFYSILISSYGIRSFLNAARLEMPPFMKMTQRLNFLQQLRNQAVLGKRVIG